MRAPRPRSPARSLRPLPSPPRLEAHTRATTHARPHAPPLSASLTPGGGGAGIGDLIETSRSTAEKAIEDEFTNIFKELETREEALLKRAKTISAKKLSALKKHQKKLEGALEALEGGAPTVELPRLEDGSIDPRETIKIAGADDPVFQAEDEAEVREMVESFGEIGDTAGLPVAPMLDAVLSHPLSHGFFAEVLGLMGSMPMDPDSGLIKPEDVELLVNMLDEFKTHTVMEQACGAICNIAGQNPELSRRFGADGGLTVLLGWLEDEELRESEDVIAAACLTVGLLAEGVPDNEALCHENDAAEKLLEVMEALEESMAVQENAMYALGTLSKTPDGRTAVVEAGAIEAIVLGLDSYQDERDYIEKAMRALFFIGQGNPSAKLTMMESGMASVLAQILGKHGTHAALIEAVGGVISTMLEKDGKSSARARKALDDLVGDAIFTLLLDILEAFSTEVSLNRVILGIFSNFGLLAGKDSELVKRAGFIDDEADAPDPNDANKGVKRIVDAMRLHSRSMDILESGCNAIWCLAKAEPRLKPVVRTSGAIELILKGLASFEHASRFCETGCAALWCLAFKDPYNKTLIGGAGGLVAVVKALTQHGLTADDSSNMVEHANIALANLTANHKPNRRLAGQAGAIKAVLAPLQENIEKPDWPLTKVMTACNALLALLTEEPENQYRFAKAKGKALLEAVAEKHKDQQQIVKLVSLLLEETLPETNDHLPRPVACTYGADAFLLFLKRNGTVFLKSLAKPSYDRQLTIFKQHIVKFSKDGKDPKKIKKWRLVSLDMFDLTVYGDDEDDGKNGQFSDVIVYYPVAKIESVHVLPQFKAAFIVKNTNATTGTIVCDSSADAQSWVAAITARLPIRSGTAKLVGKSGKATLRLAYVDEYLSVHSTDKEGAQVEIIPSDNMLSVIHDADGGQFTIETDIGGDKRKVFTFAPNTAPGTAESALAEATQWESFLLGEISRKKAEREAREAEEEAEEEKGGRKHTKEAPADMPDTIVEGDEEEEDEDDGEPEPEPEPEESEGVPPDAADTSAFMGDAEEEDEQDLPAEVRTHPHPHHTTPRHVAPRCITPHCNATPVRLQTSVSTPVRARLHATG